MNSQDTSTPYEYSEAWDDIEDIIYRMDKRVCLVIVSDMEESEDKIIPDKVLSITDTIQKMN